MRTFFYFSLSAFFVVIRGFVPHPAVRLGGQAGDSITHTEITQLGFTKSLMLFFLDTERTIKNARNMEDFTNQHTIDEIYQLVHPEWSKAQVNLHSFPLKKVIDRIQVRNALVDLNPSTKNLPSAHFDSETFLTANHRIMQLRQQVIDDVNDPTKSLDKARGKIGDLLHTLQDFYSHSNWIEMGRTSINPFIGLQENIGPIAEKHQATCTSNGCSKIQSSCNLIQKYVFKSCPMEYYDCKDNIREEINRQGLLTSGYVSTMNTTNPDAIPKPIDVEKCSHGSVMDSSSHQIPVGGINKDTMTPVYSPHYHLHYPAVKFAIEATEQFFNDLRKDLGNEKFDRLFAINPTEEQLAAARISLATRERLHFLTSTLSIGLSTSDLSFQKTVKQRLEKLLALLFSWSDPNSPTFNLTDEGVDETNVNIHSGSLLIDRLQKSRKRNFHRRFHR